LAKTQGKKKEKKKKKLKIQFKKIKKER